MLGFHKVVCTKCKGANEIDFKYCKFCGSERCSVREHSVLPEQSTDSPSLIQTINERISTLDNLLEASQYSQQKCQLKREITEFLGFLEPPKDLYTALPDDIRKFLIFKERKGRTQLHVQSCTFKGLAGRQSCTCPKTLAAKSVDSLIGKIRAIFRDLGRSGDWNPVILTGNPAASHVMKRHLHSVTVEQNSFSVAKKQAVPLMFDKLGKLCRHLTYQISREKDALTKFLFLRDRAYFSVICHSGDRGGDISLLSSNRLLELPNSDGIFVSQVAGKLFSVDNPNNFILFRSKDPDICPVRHLREFIAFAEKLHIDLSMGYLFRVKDKNDKAIVNKPMSSSLITDRLRMHLKAVSLYEGETSHSTRRGCAITLRMMGISDEQINKHIGWAPGKMIDHYANIGNLCGPKGVARQLSDAAGSNERGISELCQISNKMSEFGSLKRFYFSSGKI